MPNFEIRAGSVIGSEHVFRQANCQDKYRYLEIEADGQSYLIGVVCDGCSSGRHSEIGAALLAEFLVHEAARQLKVGQPVEQIPTELYRQTLSFLQNLSRLVLGQAPTDLEKSGFVGAYLLATVLGFIIGPEKTVIFTAGDGLLIINDQLTVLDESNAPTYPAYGLLDPHQLDDGIPTRTDFDLQILDTAQLARLAIWTDGFNPALSGLIWQLGGPCSLQRQLNVWSNQKLFSDDTTGITVSRMKDEG
jgi:hypothetical protein